MASEINRIVLSDIRDKKLIYMQLNNRKVNKRKKRLKKIIKELHFWHR